MTKSIETISLDRAKTMAPAIFATEPASYINQKLYTFTPTTGIIEQMNNQGWQLTKVQQSQSKSDLRKNYGIHIVRFQHPDIYIKDGFGGVEARPEIVVINSHDGTKPLQFEAGLFRLVCENGLVLKTQDFGGFKERHTKFTLDSLKTKIDEKMSIMNGTVDTISKWASKEMTAAERRRFATEALALRISSDRQAEEYEIMEILNPRRDADKANTLWHTFNRVQENLIKGGFQMNNRTARAITNPMEDMVLNQGLWQIADSFVAA